MVDIEYRRTFTLWQKVVMGWAVHLENWRKSWIIQNFSGSRMSLGLVYSECIPETSVVCLDSLISGLYCDFHDVTLWQLVKMRSPATSRFANLFTSSSHREPYSSTTIRLRQIVEEYVVFPATCIRSPSHSHANSMLPDPQLTLFSLYTGT